MPSADNDTDASRPPGGSRYADAGVDIGAGNRLTQRLGSTLRRHADPDMLSSVGGFAALHKLPDGYREPILVSATDGVGTKLMLALEAGRLEGLGQDLVAMSINDIVTCGARPLLFLDYYATSKLEEDAAATLIEGIAEACAAAGCSLVGGETAEMPGLYRDGDFDLAGFAVGIVEREAILGPSRVVAGDALIALPSSGVHANGFSLIRRLLADGGVDAAAEPLGEGSLLDALLAPTRLYGAAIAALAERKLVHAAAHITGGGIVDNLPRALNKGLLARIERKRWERRRPPLFRRLRELGEIDEAEMRRVFNCGVGMILCVPGDGRDRALETLNELGESAFELGEVIDADDSEHVPHVIFD